MRAGVCCDHTCGASTRAMALLELLLPMSRERHRWQLQLRCHVARSFCYSLHILLLASPPGLLLWHEQPSMKKFLAAYPGSLPSCINVLISIPFFKCPSLFLVDVVSIFCRLDVKLFSSGKRGAGSKRCRRPIAADTSHSFTIERLLAIFDAVSADAYYVACLPLAIWLEHVNYLSLK